MHSGAQKQAEADVAAARAAVQTARINLEYATVRAPIAGRIGPSLVSEGALVSQTEATQLAVIQQISTVYVNFTQSTAEVLRCARHWPPASCAAPAGRRSGARRAGGRQRAAAPGRLLFSDLSVDASTGQITLRAEVPNPDGLLLPGQFVRVRLAQAELPAGILLPQQAVTRTPPGRHGAGGRHRRQAGTRAGAVGASQNGQWVVLDGLQAGEQVIVEGFQKMMVPGAPVKPMPWSAAARRRPRPRAHRRRRPPRRRPRAEGRAGHGRSSSTGRSSPG
jgi:membrane fusion protein (multidrug efflux system)